MTLNQIILNFIEDHNNVLNRFQSILSEWDVIVESLTELDHLDPLKLPSCYFFVCSVGKLANRRGISLAIPVSHFNQYRFDIISQCAHHAREQLKP